MIISNKTENRRLCHKVRQRTLLLHPVFDPCLQSTDCRDCAAAYDEAEMTCPRMASQESSEKGGAFIQVLLFPDREVTSQQGHNLACCLM